MQKLTIAISKLTESDHLATRVTSRLVVALPDTFGSAPTAQADAPAGALALERDALALYAGADAGGIVAEGDMSFEGASPALTEYGIIYADTSIAEGDRIINTRECVSIIWAGTNFTGDFCLTS